jgi:hypothetical protein
VLFPLGNTLPMDARCSFSWERPETVSGRGWPIVTTRVYGVVIAQWSTETTKYAIHLHLLQATAGT